MRLIRAGRFQFVVSEPHPCNCELIIEGQGVASLHHNELSDLEYIIGQAKQEARLKLGYSKDDV